MGLKRIQNSDDRKIEFTHTGVNKLNKLTAVRDRTQLYFKVYCIGKITGHCWGSMCNKRSIFDRN